VRIELETCRPILQSTFRTTFWPEAELAADTIPEDDVDMNHLSELHGIHAVVADYPLGKYQPLYLKTLRSMLAWPFAMLAVIGAVDLSGKVVEHEDGVMRAERARILALRVDERVWRRAVCGHEQYYVFSGLRDDSWCLRNPCVGVGKCQADIQNQGVAFWYWASPEAELKFKIDLSDLERQLLERYEVPRLPEDRGPWVGRPPMGAVIEDA
jgi:hypothetical protein